MNLEVKIEDLRLKKLFVAIPCYGGQMMGMCTKSCLDLQGMCQNLGIEMRFSFIFNESLITRARNYLVDEFLRARGTQQVKDEQGNVVGQVEVPYSHMLFIDSDIHFDPKDVLALMAIDRDVIGAPYPKKSIKWAAVKEVVQKHPQIPPQELEKIIGDMVFNPVAGTQQFNVAEPLEVLEIGTGYMMVKRHVFEKFAEQYPEQRYKPDHVGQQFFDGSRYINAFFDCVIDRKRKIKLVETGEEKEVGGSDRYLSEDYYFCQQWRNMGGKIWLCPWMCTHHIGTYAFTGNLPAIANHLGKL
jgi:hypothetical protein